MAGVVLLTVAIIAGVVVFLNRRDAVAVPDALGGMPRIDDAQTKLIVDLFRAQADATGIESDIVLYGNGTPTAALVWVRDATMPSSDAAFDAFAAGFNQGIRASGSLGAKETETVAGVTYVCAPVLGASRGTICMWQAEDVFWLLFDLSGGTYQAGKDLAVVAQEAVGSA
jgi:hypothetical protein